MVGSYLWFLTLKKGSQSQPPFFWIQLYDNLYVDLKQVTCHGFEFV
jgi:hypothetical protein